MIAKVTKKISVINEEISKIKSVRVLQITIRSFLKHQCSLHAAGLTYFSLLAVIPVLCLLLLFAKSMGAGDFARHEINTRLDAMISNVEKAQDEAPAFLQAADEKEAKEKRDMALAFGRQAREISNTMFDKIDKFNVGTLGWLGVVMLLWTVVSTLGMVESAFNEIWGVIKARPVWKRFYLYAFVSLVLPLLTALAMSLPVLRIAKDVSMMVFGSVQYTKCVGDFLVAVLESKLLGFCFTFCFASLAFTFFLSFMPNRKVGLRSSITGGVITAFLFGAWMKICAIAQVGIASSSALYGSFAFLPIVLAWINMSWQIVLLGCSLTYALEHVYNQKN